MNKELIYGVSLLCVCVAACGEPEQDDPTIILLDMGPADMAPEDMPAPEFDFVYTIPDIPIVVECDPSSEDLPDRFAIDSNCDGIDGDESRSLFVTSYGDDTNDGSKFMPLLTVQKAIDMAAVDPTKDWVLVQEGRYQETLEMADGVNIAGGYELGWRRDGNGFSQIVGGNPTVRASNILSTTYVMNLEVRPTEQLADERFSVVTMSVEQSPGVILERMFILGGTGRRGTDGSKGTNGAPGAKGSNGGRGREDSGGLCSSNDRPTPGNGGTSSCGAGGGGRGGDPEKSDRTGKAGQAGDSVGSATGGASGSGGATKRNGEDGEDGEPGTTGAAGRGAGASGSFSGYEWQGEFGLSGDAGTGGAGGGGGGGGGGGEDGCDSWGGAGAGGGAGGCAGEGGFGGGPGGASVALMLVDSDIVIRTSRIVMGQGGAGGDGGAGGFGGAGGEGGEGGRREDDSGTGGSGGAGGKGGTGGPGGGGPGGPSFGIYSNIALTVEPSETNYVEGAAGFGGNGAGPDGRGATGPMLPISAGPM